MSEERVRLASMAGRRARIAFACGMVLGLGACAGERAATPVVSVSAAGAAAPSRGPLAGGSPALPAEDDAGIAIGAGDPVWGSRTALVTIVEFSDFQCPFCARAEPVLAKVRERYGSETVRLIWKQSPLPFHANARDAAEASAGVQAMAGSEAFWRFRDAAFAGQRTLDEDHLVSWAAYAGVRDTSRFRAGLEAHTWAPAVDAGLAQAKAAGVDGTPTFFINGVRLIGAQPFESFQAAIDEQLRAARAMVASGVPIERLYVELSKANVANEAAREQASEDDDFRREAKTVYRVPIGKSPARGAPSALVTIVEFADYQCPYCARAEATVRELRGRYGDDLRVIYKDLPLPFHVHAEPAAEAALEVRAERGDAAFWAMHDTLFDHPDRQGDEDLVGLAVAAGANEKKVQAAIASHAHRGEIEADEELADDLGLEGTPQFLIDGRRVAGAQPTARFTEIVDEEMAKARALVAAGTARAAVYDAMMRDAKGPSDPERQDVAALPPGDPARGPVTAKVTLHEFGDFQCPFCVRVEATVKDLESRYAGKLRVVWHDDPLPMHKLALPAARAAREARRQKGDPAFWALHDWMMTARGAIDRDALDERARAMGLDLAAWKRALDEGPPPPALDADRRAAEALDINGTPAFLIVPAGSTTGYPISGAQGAVRFRKLIERAMREAK